HTPFTAADLTVVIPAYGRLPERLPTGVRVIVVDDASPTPLAPTPLKPAPLAPAPLEPAPPAPADGSAPEPAVHVIPPPRVTWSRHDTNRGPGAARNTGLAAVATPLVAFVDTDVVLPDGWLEPLLAHFADERVALVAPRIAGAPGVSWLAGYEQRHSPLDLGAEPARIAAGTRVSYVPAATMVCRTSVVRDLGGFDADMRLGEDVDLVWRLTEAGHRCRYEPASVVLHEPRPSLPDLLRQRFGYGRSAASLARRHPGALAPVRMSGWSALSWVLLALRRPLLALGVAGGTTIALQRKLTDVPPADSARLAGLGHLAAGRQFANAIVRVWWPAAVLVALIVRRARLPVALAFSVPTMAEALGTRSVQPVLDAPLRVADQMAYGAGVWAGVIAERTAAPLLPELTNWPQRAAG
ncbi:MAG: mycofactocin biosynthesis glycosyltransferase MftF, partial [Ilumatobacteraceae bacterium]